MIPYGRQNITQDDINAVTEVLNSDWLTQGPKVPEFEQAVARYTGASHAVAMNSATSALHAACLALDTGPGDLVWTVPNTFVATANCGVLCGASIDFVDIDAKSYCMDPVALAEKLKNAEISRRLPKILIPVHFAGQSANMVAIHKLAKYYEIKIVEDAAHAIGGRYLDSPIGNCQFSDISVFSFHPVKVMTTAEGGVATTNDPEIAERLRRIRTNGITKNFDDLEGNSSEPWNYQQLEIGLNYRMTDLQAALGISQIKRLNKFVEHRRQLSQRYSKLLADLPVICPWKDPSGDSAYHLYPLLIDSKRTNTNRGKLFTFLRDAGIGVNVHYIPVHTQPFYQQFGFQAGDFPISESYYAQEISLPIFYDLTFDEQNSVVETIHSALIKCT